MSSRPSPPSSILFIGNSFTAANGGLDASITQLTRSMGEETRPFSAAITVPGATLKGLWNTSDARKIIGTSAFEVVVLQEDIPEGNLSAFRKYAKKFIKATTNSGSRPVLLMAWAYDRLNWVSQDEIIQAHNKIAAETGVAVAPVGIAWSRVMTDRPDLDLFDEDREHPSASGSYLASCVVYATLMGVSPEGLSGQPDTVGAQDAEYLARVAWETVEKYQ
jgi:hypothetical protein